MCFPTGREGWGERSSWKLGRQPGALAWNANCLTTLATPLCFDPAKVTGLSCSSYCPLLQECLLNLFVPPGWRECRSQPNPPLSRLSILGSFEFSSLLAFWLYSHLPTFKRFSQQISQMYLCIDWGILCWIIAVKWLELQAERLKGSLTPPFLWYHWSMLSKWSLNISKNPWNCYLNSYVFQVQHRK